jgi:hypothetical protein
MPLSFALAALEPRSLNRAAQCDLTRPGCSGCAKLGKICPGYREESDLLFRNEKHRVTCHTRKVLLFAGARMNE